MGERSAERTEAFVRGDRGEAADGGSTPETERIIADTADWLYENESGTSLSLYGRRHAERVRPLIEADAANAEGTIGFAEIRATPAQELPETIRSEVTDGGTTPPKMEIRRNSRRQTQRQVGGKDDGDNNSIDDGTEYDGPNPWAINQLDAGIPETVKDRYLIARRDHRRRRPSIELGTHNGVCDTPMDTRRVPASIRFWMLRWRRRRYEMRQNRTIIERDERFGGIRRHELFGDK